MIPTKANKKIHSTLESTTNMEKNKVQDKQSPPEGYMTGDEFGKAYREQITKFYKENGLL